MNKKLIVALILVIIVVGGIAAYFVSRPAAAPQNRDQSHDTSSHTHGETIEGKEVIYTNDGFSPDSLTAKKGTTIRIINKSSGPLEFSSDDHPTHTNHPEFNMTTIAAGKESTLELKTVGTWGYHNHLKASDTGMITVTE